MYFNIILFVSLFLLVYFVYYVFVLRSKKALEKLNYGKEMSFLKKNYNLDFEKINTKKLAHIIVLTNSFIMSFTTVIVCLLNDWIKNFYLWMLSCMLMALLILFPLIIILYHLIGNYFNKKQKEM